MLSDVVLPFLFFELWYIFIAFLFVVLIETLIVNMFLKQNFLKTFKVLFAANFFTTIVGYFLQGLIRIFIGLVVFASINKISENEIFNSIVGNIGLPEKAVNNNAMVMLTITISMMIALIISIIVERKILIKKFEGIQVEKITMSICIANIVSYVLLFLWVYFNYLQYIKT